jgi:L-asparaginase
MTAFFIMKKIALIYMGGTFGCVGEPLAPMPADTFLPKLQTYLPSTLNIECFVAPVIKDSSACSAADWLQLAAQIQNLQQKNFEHFVIIHGTDTLSYAGAVLSYLLVNSVYVVLTGSQYPLLNIDASAKHDDSDALSNLLNALTAVQQLNKGVYLSFDHEWIHARSALKRHTTDLAAFTGLNAETPLPHLDKAIFITDERIEKAAAFNCISYMLQPITAEQHLYNLQQFFFSPPHCLILQGFGTANFAATPEIIALLQQFKQKNCLVILSTQVPFGVVDQRYAVNAWVKDAEILFGNGFGHADLYAKALKMYLQYDAVTEWQQHWYDE